MKFLFEKLQILAGFIASAYREWCTEVCPRDLDETYCCDGRECGCQGSSVREVFGKQK